MNKQSGNILLFILIAILLIGLLTLSLTRSSNTTNETGDFEQNAIIASQIMRYAKTMEDSVTQLLARGCSENDISFENDIVAGYTNTFPSAPTTNECHIFEDEGIGQAFEIPKTSWLDTSFSADANYGEYHFPRGTCIYGVGDFYDLSGNGNCDITPVLNEELLITLPYLKQNICEALNRLAGNNFATIPAEADSTLDPNKFIGSYSGSSEVGNNADLYGVATGCLQQAPTGTYPDNAYIFYHVLHVR